MERKFEQELYSQSVPFEVGPVSLGWGERNMPHNFAFFR